MSADTPWYSFDPDLIRRTTSGDPEAAEVFGRQLIKVADSFTRRYCQGGFRHVDQDDVVGTVVLKVMGHLRQYRGDSPFHVYVGRIVRNELLSRARRSAGREDRHVSLDAVDDETAQALADRLSDTDGRRDTVLHDACALVRRELAALENPLHRRCAEMWLNGDDYAAMADALHMTAGGVAATIHRIRKRLMAVLGADFADGGRLDD